MGGDHQTLRRQAHLGDFVRANCIDETAVVRVELRNGRVFGCSINKRGQVEYSLDGRQYHQRDVQRAAAELQVRAAISE